jgi:hypothetical protein
VTVLRKLLESGFQWTQDANWWWYGMTVGGEINTN